MNPCDHDPKFKDNMCLACWMLYNEGQIKMLSSAIEGWKGVLAETEQERDSALKRVKELEAEFREARNDARDAGVIERRACDERDSALAREAESTAAVEVLRWILNLHCGVSKTGGEASDAEYEDAIEQGKKALDVLSTSSPEAKARGEGA